MKKEEKQPLKENGVGTVMSWIFTGLAAVISVFAGIVTIKAGQVAIGILFLVLGAFVFVPRKYMRISKALKVIIFILAFFVLLIISGHNSPKPEQQYEYYAVGQPFNLTFGKNVFSMKINNISRETNITVNNGQNISTSGYYLFVNGEILNLGKATVDMQFKSDLRDGDGNVYALFAKDTKVGGFQPNLEKNFYNVFEISKQASGLKFYVKDKTQVIKVVNLE